MSTRDIKGYIGTQFPEIDISWINDSSCKIVFPSKEQADQAYMQFSVRPAALKVNLDQPVVEKEADEEPIELDQETA